MGAEHWLPVAFAAIMGLALVVYAILDGYDLGVGILLPLGERDEADSDTMVASIGPFWDANETWLVLAIGVMLIAFPAAHSLVLYHLYLPTAVMLIGLILRGVAFDFRAKAALDHKYFWDLCFKIGSLITALAQGYMLGHWVMGFAATAVAYAFAILSAVGVACAYAYIGAAWLVMKTEGGLQLRAVRWARWAGRVSALGVLMVSVVNPLIDSDVYSRWFTYPLAMFVLIIPTICIACFVSNEFILRHLPRPNDRYCWLPFVLVIGFFLTSFVGLVFSVFPEVIPDGLTIWQAASATESLAFIFIGAVIVVPVILAYTVFAYWVFRGKTTDLHYH